MSTDCILPKVTTVEEVRIFNSGYGISTTSKRNNRADLVFKKGTDAVFRNIQEKKTLDKFELGTRFRKMEFVFTQRGHRATMVFDDEL